MSLPELPPPEFEFVGHLAHIGPYYTAEQMHAMYRAGLERAAQAVYEAWDETGSPDAWRCVEAIRALKDTPVQQEGKQ